MLRISIYHWLPLADNMLPDIERALHHEKIASDIQNSGEHVQYTLELDTGYEKVGKVQLKGKINPRGFSQSIINIPPPKDMSLGPVLEVLLPILQERVASFLFEIMPYAVRNKTGVLEEKIVSFQQFETRRFETYLDNISKRFLRNYRTIAVMVDKDYSQDFEAGFYIDIKDINFRIKGTNSPNLVSCDETKGIFLFYSEEFEDQELLEFESVIYKYCVTVTYLRFIERTIDILKDVRDHVIPLRRQLAISLQRNTEEHFVWLTRMKKYLTYVNIKLPIIERVKNHLKAAYNLGVKFKLELFSGASNLEPFPTLANIQLIVDKNKPLRLDALIVDALERLEKLYDEAQLENKILSNELSQVLSGSLQSEHVQITARDLDATRSLLELDRGGKNRSNALKVLSVVLSGSLGLSIAEVVIKFIDSNHINFFNNWDFLLRVIFLTLAITFAWSFTEWHIAQKSNLYRLVIPVIANLPSESLVSYMDIKSPYNRFEAIGQRRVVNWSQKFAQLRDYPWYVPFWNRKTEFNVTMDYEKRGYLYSVSLEVEHKGLKFDDLYLVIQTLSDMDRADCLRDYKQQQTSLLAEVLIHLNINLADNLVALNKVLAMPIDELARDIEAYIRDPQDPSISEEDRIFMNDIHHRQADYVEWLIQADRNQHNDIPLSLLGKINIKHKLELIMQLKFES